MLRTMAWNNRHITLLVQWIYDMSSDLEAYVSHSGDDNLDLHNRLMVCYNHFKFSSSRSLCKRINVVSRQLEYTTKESSIYVITTRPFGSITTVRRKLTLPLPLLLLRLALYFLKTISWSLSTSKRMRSLDRGVYYHISKNFPRVFFFLLFFFS